MNYSFWVIKKEAKALLQGNYNGLVLTFFIPFILSVAIILKSFRGMDIYLLAEEMYSFKGTLIMLGIQLLISVGSVAFMSGISGLYNKKKKSVAQNYAVAFKNLFKYLPAFLISTAFPLFVSMFFHMDNIHYLYDHFFILIDLQIYLLVANVLNVMLVFLSYYLTLGLLFIPCILVDNQQIGAFAAIMESFRLTKRKKIRLFFFHLGFIGWYLLGMFAFVIGVIWAMVYMNAAVYIYFRKLLSSTDVDLSEGGNNSGRN